MARKTLGMWLQYYVCGQTQNGNEGGEFWKRVRAHKSKLPTLAQAADRSACLHLSSWSSLGGTLWEHYTLEEVAVIRGCQLAFGAFLYQISMELLYHYVVMEKSLERSNGA